LPFLLRFHSCDLIQDCLAELSHRRSQIPLPASWRRAGEIILASSDDIVGIRRMRGANMSDPIAPLLAQFPGPIRLRSPLWWRRAVVWSIIWVVFGLAVIAQVLPVGLIIVGVIGPWWLASGDILLDDTGFIYEWRFWPSRRFLWTEVDRFEIRKPALNEEDLSGGGSVVFDFAPREGTCKGNPAMIGRLGLPDNVISTGLTPDLLARLMTEWRERALRP
jgi:hypothetical protein